MTKPDPKSLIDCLGLSVREVLPVVPEMPLAYGLKECIKVVACGRLTTPAEVARTLCRDVGTIASEHSPMLALCCIQSLQCNGITCPTGIKPLTSGCNKRLGPALQAERIRHYVENMVYEVGVIAHSCGVREPHELQRFHARIVTETGRSLPLDQVYG